MPWLHPLGQLPGRNKLKAVAVLGLGFPGFYKRFSSRPQGFPVTEVGLIGGLPVERLVRSLAVVPRKKVLQARPLFMTIGTRSQVHPFMLDGPPQAFHEDVVVAAPAPVHADTHGVAPEYSGKCFGRELTALIGVEDLR